ncbi:MAG: tRNA pseudouridine(38-40) synthase TruA [Pseudomonadota bacterium]
MSRPSQRVKITVEYDGRGYAGWQRQADQSTVQGVLEAAAEKLDGNPVTIQGAGRTDAGVHATGQVAHFDLSKERPIRKVADALNFHLRPERVAVLKAEAVGPDFNARFSARGRAYRYLMVNRRADLALDRGRAWRVPQHLDVNLMHDAAQCLVGLHDFSTFRDAECQAKTPVKTLDAIALERIGDSVELTVSAPSFLHRQVRSIVGSLVEIGRGARPANWLEDILNAHDRSCCGPVAPADGLYLEQVIYPAEDGPT